MLTTNQPIEHDEALQQARFHAWFDKVKENPTLLEDAARQIESARTRMASAMVDLFEAVESFRNQSGIPSCHIDTWLHNECGISREDLPIIRKFHQVLGASKDTLRRRRTSFETVKTLVRTSETARREALFRLDAGQSVDAREVRAIARRSRNEELSDDAAIHSSRRQIISRVVVREGRKVVDAFERDALQLHELLVEYAEQHTHPAIRDDHPQEAYENECAAHAAVTELAKKILPVFEDLFPGPKAAEEDVSLIMNTEGAERGRRAYCYVILEELAAGRFWLENCERLALDVNLDPFEATRYLSGTESGNRRKSRLGMRPVKRLKSIELCAGAGGEAIGLCAAGFEPELLVDNGFRAARTLRTNRSDWNVSRINLKTCDLAERFLPYRGVIDLVAGGVPCQPVSTSGKGKGADDARNLFPQAIEIVRIVKPKAFFFENVQGLDNRDHIALRLEILAKLEDAGYSVGQFTLNATDWGLSQDRKRVIIYGFANEIDARKFVEPTRNAGFHQPKKASNLAELVIPYMSGAPWFRVHPTMTFSAQEQARYDKWAQAWLEKSAAGPTPTVTASVVAIKNLVKRWNDLGFDINDLVDEPLRPDQLTDTHIAATISPVTVSILKRLQGFPDDWQLDPKAKKAALRRLVGNAFPPVLARMIGHRIHQVISGKEIDLEAALADGIRSPKLKASRRDSKFPDDPVLEGVEIIRQQIFDRKRRVLEPPDLDDEPIYGDGDFTVEDEKIMEAELSIGNGKIRFGRSRVKSPTHA